jgi:starch synthase
VKKALINGNIREKDLEAFKDASNAAMFKGGAHYADAISFGDDNIEKSLLDEFTKVKGKKVLPFKGWDADLTDYIELYQQLAGK